MFTGADCGCSILDDIPADIELSMSNCAGKKRREKLVEDSTVVDLLIDSHNPNRHRRFLSSFSIGLNKESFSIAKI